MVFVLFEQIKHLHIELTKSKENIKLITAKLTTNKTKCNKLQTLGI